MSLASVGGPFFLANLDAHATNTDLPYNHFGGGTTPYDAKVLIIPNPNRALYLDLYDVCPGTTAMATALKVRCYGYVVGKGLGRDCNQQNPGGMPGTNATTKTNFVDFTDMVIPLEDPTTGEQELSFDLATAVSQTATSLATNVTNVGGTTTTPKTFTTSKRRTVYTAGADYLCVLVTQADNRSGGVVMGRFVA